jgi:hypothetical protein|uniref:Flagellar and Swarming motility protein n=1 Tax=Siphoviridae sp. ctfR912 TaxID=2825596 RepID=A0A8S5Q9A8_9CAUD|nr:MAG TPA: Flagellar and Swarming motility protein [Siphoviridae sp. ctfR912]
MFIELTRRSDGKKIKVSKHAIGYMEDVGIIEWKKENLFKKGKWVEDTKDRFTELNIFGKSVYVEETIQEIQEMINGKSNERRLSSKQIDDLLDEAFKDDIFGNPINYFIKQEDN